MEREQESPEPSLGRVWLGLILALSAFGALMAAALSGKASLTSAETIDPARLVSWWSPIFGLGVLAIPVVIERAPEPLRSLGIRRPSLLDFAWGVLMFLLAISAMAEVVPVVNRHLPAINVRLDRISLFNGWTLVFCASIFEELYFRGYLIERFEIVTGKTWIAATASLILFAAGHLPSWGPAGVVRNLVWGAFVTALYLLRRNLIVCIMMHFLQDALSIPVLWYVPLKRLLARGG